MTPIATDSGYNAYDIGDVETDRFVLEVYECVCGFHLGVDATYLEQVDAIIIVCPSCEEVLTIY